MNQNIPRFLLVALLALTGIACQYNDRLTRAPAPQVYWPGTKAHKHYTSYFRLDEVAARQRLKSLGIPDYPPPSSSWATGISTARGPLRRCPNTPLAERM
ncbi:MAG: hypothetical protein ACAI34_13225 [Verrucomicrobium sp.]